MSRLAVVIGGLLVACGSTADRQRVLAGHDEANEPCAACLARGGTWQPEARECTADCALQDISCFRDACPGPCGRGSCGDCAAREACEAAGCSWQIDGEAMWCRAR